MKFSYKGKNSAGVIVTGTMVASDRTEAVALIRDSGILPVLVESKSSLSNLSVDLKFFSSVKLSEKITMTKNLSGMLKAGLALSRALTVLGKQTSNNYLKTILNDVLENIDKGGTLSDGLAKFPKVFSSLFVAMVKSGEESGSLPESLLEIGVNLEKSYSLNRKIKSAMMYPMIIMGAIVLIGILMFIYVVPTLIKTFQELNADLPSSTKIVIWLSNTISNHILLLILGFMTIGAFFYFGSKVERVKKAFDFVVVRLPVIGTIIQEINSARTTRTLSSLLSSGVNISRALAITKEVLQNYYYKNVIDEAMNAVEKGEPTSGIFKKNLKLYPVMVGEMMEVGEETGKMTSMLLDIAIFYEAEVDAKTKDLSTIVEPVLMIFIGAAVGFFAVSMLSPMYSIMDSIK